MITVNTYLHYTFKIVFMQADDKQNIIEKQKILVTAVSFVVRDLLKRSGKSGRKISEEYDIGLGVISKLDRNLVSDIKLSTLWKLMNAFNISPENFIKMILDNLPKNFNFYE